MDVSPKLFPFFSTSGETRISGGLTIQRDSKGGPRGCQGKSLPAQHASPLLAERVRHCPAGSDPNWSRRGTSLRTVGDDVRSLSGGIRKVRVPVSRPRRLQSRRFQDFAGVAASRESAACLRATHRQAFCAQEKRVGGALPRCRYFSAPHSPFGTRHWICASSPQVNRFASPPLRYLAKSA